MVIYLDNAATSYPKPPQVARAMAEYMLQGMALIHISEPTRQEEISYDGCCLKQT